MARIFFAIFNANPIAIKCTTNPIIAACIRLPSIAQDTKNPTSEGTLIKTASILPFANNCVLEVLVGMWSLSNCGLDR